MKTMLMMTVAAGTLAAFGANSSWTGAADGCWTNAANWTAGVPGRYYAPDGTLTGSTAETATFGASTGATTIDLDGLYSIGEVVVSENGPRYTFGASSTQILPLEAVYGGAKNKFTVNATVTQAPVILAILQLGKGNDGGNVTVLVTNNSSDTLVVNDFGYMQGTKRIYGRFAGSGATRVEGVWISAPSGAVPNAQTYISTSTAAGVTFTQSFTFPGFFNSGAANSKIVIADGVKITMSNSSAWGDLGTPPVTFDGTGEMSVTCSGYAQLYTAGNVDIKCKLTQTSVPSGDNGLTFYGRGTYRLLNPENVLSGKIRGWGNAEDNLVIERARFGKVGEDGNPLDNISAILSANMLTVRFTGDQADETDRTFGFCNHASFANATYFLRMEQSGSAEWKILNDLYLAHQSGKSPTYRLYLQGGGAGNAVWSGVLKDDADGNKLEVTKQGAGTWVYGNAMTYTGETSVEAGTLLLDADGAITASAVTLRGGTLAVASGTAKTLASVAVAADAAIDVPDGATLTVAGLSRTDGVLAVKTANEAKFVCAALAGQTPAWLTVNGLPASFDANGKLVKRQFVLTDEIAARGGVIPDGADKVVGITTDGTEGPITLEKEPTAVNTLVQRTKTSAVVSLAENRTLTLGGTLAAEEGAAPLTVGAEPGEGTLAVSGDKLTVIASDPASPVTVNAALDPSFTGTLEKQDVGELRLLAQQPFAGQMKLTGGSVVVTNAGTLAGTLEGEAGTVFRVDGPGDYSSGAAQSGFGGDFVISGGRVTMTGAVYKTVSQFGSKAGALVFTNGAQLVLDGPACDDLTLAGKRIRFSGSGPDGRGALVSREYFNFMFQSVTLDGDTVFSLEKGVKNPGYINIHGNYGTAGLLDMQGHALKVTSPGPNRLGYFVFNSATVTNAGPMRIENTILAAYAPAKLGGKDDSPIIFGTNSQFTSYATKRIERPIAVEAYAESRMNLVLNTSAAVGDTNSYAFAGPWTFAPPEGRTGEVYFDQSGSVTNATVTFAGPVTGAGGFRLKPSLTADICFTHPTNTFTGGIIWSDNPSWTDTGYGAVVRFLHPCSPADYAKVSCNYGRSTVYMPNWTAADVIRFANEAKLQNRATVAVDTSLADGKTATIELSDAEIESASFGLGHEGEGTLALSGTWTKEPTLIAYGGKLKLTGEGAKTLGVTRSQQNLRTSVIPDLAIEDSGTATITTNGIIVGYGRVGTAKTDRQARMSVRNAKLVVPSDTSAYIPEYFRIGYGCESGVLEIGDGAEITALPTLGCVYSGITGAGAGAIWQTGGKLTPVKRTGQTNERFSIGCGNDCWGFYDLAAGELDASATDTRIAYGKWASGVFRQTGGTAKFNNLYVGWADGGYASAAYYMTGGTVTCKSLQLPYVNYGGYGSRTTFTLDGDCTFTVNNGGSNVPVAQAGAKDDAVDHGTVTIVNLLNGGTLRALGFTKKNSYGIVPSAVRAYFNFDGGTLATGGDSDVFGAGEWTVDRVTSFGQGATFDVPSGKTCSAYVPVDAPTGNGIASVAWAGTEAAARTYVGAPAVDIYGDGYGASAVALFDRATGRVTGIKVLSPGCGYTQAEAVIRPTAKSQHACDHYLTNAVAFTASTPVSGGLRKTGAGMLVLCATNTYAGATVVSGGTLKLAADDVLRAGTELVLDGGTLDLNGKRAAFGGISGTVGTVTGGSVSVGGTWTVDLAALEDGSFADLDGEVVFADGAKVTFVNTLVLDDDARRSWKVLRAKGGIVNPPTLEGTLPKGWVYRANANVIRVCRDIGTAIIVR